MKHRLLTSSSPFAFAAALLFTTLSLSAHDGKDHDKAPAKATTGALVPVDAKTDATWLAQARATYPADFCPVCDDHIAREASPKVPEYVYHVAGKPDRLVRFCSDDECVDKFKNNPAKYLKMIDDAGAEKAPPAK